MQSWPKAGVFCDKGVLGPRKTSYYALKYDPHAAMPRNHLDNFILDRQAFCKDSVIRCSDGISDTEAGKFQGTMVKGYQRYLHTMQARPPNVILQPVAMNKTCGFKSTLTWNLESLNCGSRGCFGWTFDASILDSSFPVNLTHNGKLLCCSCAARPFPFAFSWRLQPAFQSCTLRYPKITPSWDVEGEKASRVLIPKLATDGLGDWDFKMPQSR